MPSSKVTVRDNGLKALARRVAQVGRGYALTVGIHAEQGAQTAQGGGKATLLEVATINEYGLGNVPERSFIRDWFDLNQAKHLADLKKIGKAIISGAYDAPTGLGRLGALYQGEVQARISQGIPPPNAPSTIQRKGSSTPLINTGQLRSAILWKVEKLS